MTKIDKSEVHPLWLRLTHWLNVVAVFIMVTSGWRIYNASPVWDFRIPEGITLGGWLAGALMWHFAAMWLLLLNGLVYLAVNVFFGRLSHQFFPLTPRKLWADIAAFFKGKLDHRNLKKYNAIQKFLYLFVIFDIVMLVMSGLVLWKSVQFPLLRELLGGYEICRRIHFIAMAGLTGFAAVHVVMALVVPRTLLAMVRGR